MNKNDLVNEENIERVYYTVQEVAEILRVDPRTIYALLNEGILKGFKVGKGKWRIPRDKFQEYERKMLSE